MKQLTQIAFFTCLISLNSILLAQESPIYDRSEDLMQSTDTIPEFKSKTQKLKLTGTIYQNDGVTPVEGVILYIEQPDENGDFDLRHSEEKRYVLHRSWVKTDADGKYTFYTFIPGGDRRYNQMQQIFPTLKELFKTELALESLLFENDPLLTKRCRKQLENNNQTQRILTPKQEDGILVAQKDIVLP